MGITRALVAISLGAFLLVTPGVTEQAKQPAAPRAQQQSQETKQPAAPGAQQQSQDAKQQAQPPAKQQSQPQVFKAGVNEVILAVTVTDDKGRFVSNLEQKDFRIQDEGRVQRITYFYHDSPALRQQTVIGFLVDMSSSSSSHWSKFQEATKEMIWGLLPNDKNFTGYLISYSTTAELLVNTTYDPDRLTEKVDRMKPGGGAALYNAIHMACTDRTLIPGEPYQPRRIIVVIGDGHDTASDYTLDQVIELANRNLVTVYGVSTLAFGATSDEADNLERLAKETGGHVEYPLSNPYKDVSGFLSKPSDDGNYALSVGSGGYAAAISSAINQAVQHLQGEITTQYILRYVPDIDPETARREKRRLKVDVPTLPAGSVKIQTRPYYYPYEVRQ